MLIELLGTNGRPVAINTEFIVRLVRDNDNPDTVAYIVMVKGDNYQVKHSYDELKGVLGVKCPFQDRILAFELEQQVNSNPTTAVVHVEVGPPSTTDSTYRELAMSAAPSIRRSGMSWTVDSNAFMNSPPVRRS